VAQDSGVSEDRREEESHNENNEPSMSVLHIDNDGPLIVVSNYLESEPAQARYLYLFGQRRGISVAYPAELARIYF
jgi:hypothetical protein